MLSKWQEYQRGWPVLLASALGTGSGVAVLMAYSIGSFIAPLTAEFGWTRAEVAAAPLFYAIATMLVGPLVGALADRWGSRRIVLLSQSMLALAFVLLTQLRPPIGWLYAGYATLALLGSGTLPVVFSRAITGWFVSSRGFALGLSLIGTGVVGALLPTYVNELVQTYGWRGAYLGLAVLPLLLGLPLSWLCFRDPPVDMKPSTLADQKTASVADPGSFLFSEAIRSVAFWQMAVSFMVVAIAVSAVLSHTQSLLVDRGVTRAAAAALLGLFGIAVSCGRLVSGYMLDMLRAPIVAAGMFAAPAVACVLLWASGSNLWLCGGAIMLVGIAGGAEHDIAAFFVAKYFGRAHFAAIYGLLYALYGLGGGFGPLLAGAIYDAIGSYDPALLGGVGIFVFAALLISCLRPPMKHRPV